MSDKTHPILDAIKQAARALTAPPEFPERMSTIHILKKTEDNLNCRSRYEARKVATADGPRYEIFGIASVFLSKARIAPTEGRLSRPDGSPLFTKEETLAKMKYLDGELAKMGRVEKDGDHVRHYHGRYHQHKA